MERTDLRHPVVNRKAKRRLIPRPQTHLQLSLRGWGLEAGGWGLGAGGWGLVGWTGLVLSGSPETALT